MCSGWHRAKLPPPGLEERRRGEVLWGGAEVMSPQPLGPRETRREAAKVRAPRPAGSSATRGKTAFLGLERSQASLAWLWMEAGERGPLLCPLKHDHCRNEAQSRGVAGVGIASFQGSRGWPQP